MAQGIHLTISNLYWPLYAAIVEAELRTWTEGVLEGKHQSSAFVIHNFLVLPLKVIIPKEHNSLKEW